MRSNFNYHRKLFHLSGTIFIIFYHFAPYKALDFLPFLENERTLVFAVLFSIYLSLQLLEILRKRYQFFQKLFLAVASKLLKPEEIEKSHGSIPYFLGLSVTIGFFPKELAIISALFLYIGDPAAAFIGSHYGKIKIGSHKTLEGFLAGAIAAFAAGFLYFIVLAGDQSLSPALFTMIIASGAAGGFILELFSKRGFWDDNFVIPVGSATIMTTVYALSGNTPLNQLLFSFYNLLVPTQ